MQARPTQTAQAFLSHFRSGIAKYARPRSFNLDAVDFAIVMAKVTVQELLNNVEDKIESARLHARQQPFDTASRLMHQRAPIAAAFAQVEQESKSALALSGARLRGEGHSTTTAVAAVEKVQKAFESQIGKIQEELRDYSSNAKTER